MRKPPDDSRFFQKRWTEKGPYFAILDQHGQEFAASRVFRNDAWYAVGCELLKEVPDAKQRCEEEAVAWGDQRLRGFTGILIQLTDAGGYQFVYITVSGRMLLTSVTFSSCLEAEKAADVFRKIVCDIVLRTKWVTCAPS